MNEHQRRWQAVALTALLDNAKRFKRGPWIPAMNAVAFTRHRANCSSQAASGTLRALRSVGLADSCETMEGNFWKATEAAERARELYRLEDSLGG